jgi:hypothetical protein
MWFQQKSGSPIKCKPLLWDHPKDGDEKVGKYTFSKVYGSILM